MKLYPIVEGHGEVRAVPVLLRRLFDDAGCHALSVGSPIRRPASQLRSEEGVQVAVRLAILQGDCGAILILFDGEDECPLARAKEVAGWAARVSGSTPCAIVVAYREYETWFLSALESLRGKRGIRTDAVAPPNPESRRDAKSALEEYMPPSRGYSETLDQPAMSALLDLGSAYRRNRSFRRLVSAMAILMRRLGCDPGAWPPTSWCAADTGTR